MHIYQTHKHTHRHLHKPIYMHTHAHTHIHWRKHTHWRYTYINAPPPHTNTLNELSRTSHTITHKSTCTHLHTLRAHRVCREAHTHTRLLHHHKANTPQHGVCAYKSMPTPALVPGVALDHTYTQLWLQPVQQAGMKTKVVKRPAKVPDSLACIHHYHACSHTPAYLRKCVIANPINT